VIACLPVIGDQVPFVRYRSSDREIQTPPDQIRVRAKASQQRFVSKTVALHGHHI